jgi:uncharacterized protein with beta-barrel porin domain
MRSSILAVLVLLFAATFGGEATACGGVFTTRNPACPDVNATNANPHLAGQTAILDSAAQFLQKLGAIIATNSAAGQGSNAQGDGADLFIQQRYRAWSEGYGLASHLDARGDFTGDHRWTAGGVGGFGFTIAQGLMVGLSVDQSHTKVDISGAAQSGRFDLTQVGALAGYENGPWNLGVTVVRGSASVDTSRTDAFGMSTASYDARLWGAMGELSYYHELPDNSRFVPRLTIDWMQARTDAFTETGGAPVSGSAVTATRTRLMVGGELGHSWLVRRTIVDLMVYGRLVDNVMQNLGTFEVSDPTGGLFPRLIGGVEESTLGADTGATLSAKLSDIVRLYAVYDARLRGNFASHAGTVGAEFRW